MSIFIILSFFFFFFHNKNESFASYVQTGNSSFNTIGKNAIKRVFFSSIDETVHTHDLFYLLKYNEQTVDENDKFWVEYNYKCESNKRGCRVIEDRAREIEYIGLEYWLWVKSDSKNVWYARIGIERGQSTRIERGWSRIKYLIRKNNLIWKIICVIERWMRNEDGLLCSILFSEMYYYAERKRERISWRQFCLIKTLLVFEQY